MVLLGGYYGDGKSASNVARAGMISEFLLGAVAKGSTVLDPKFVTIGKVGSGYSLHELKLLKEWLEDYTEVYDPNARTPSDNYWMGWHAQTPLDIPDVWFRPQTKQSSTNTESSSAFRSPLVVEIMASELFTSTNYNSGLVVRHPRIYQIRWGKNWTEAETKDNMLELYNSNTAFRINDDDDGKTKSKTNNQGRRKKGGSTRRGVGGVVANRSTNYLGSETTELKSKCLRGAGINILSRDQNFRERIARMITENGGEIHANYLSKSSDTPTDFIITDNDSGIGFKNLVNSDEINILTSKWLEECISENRLIDYVKDDTYYFHLGKESRSNHLEDYQDSYGDSYTETIQNVDDLKLCLDKASHMLGASTDQVSPAQMCGSDRNLFVNMMSDPSSIWSSLKDKLDVDDFELLVHESKSIFAGRCLVYCPILEDGDVIIALYDMIRNGAERSNDGVGNCTHVLIDVKDEASIKNAREAMEKLRNASHGPVNEITLIFPKWVDFCIEKNEYMCEREILEDGVHGPLPANANTA